METESLECRVFRKEYKNLHTGLRHAIDTVVQTSFSKSLIPGDIQSIAGNHADGLARDVRTTTFLNAIQDCVKLKSSALHSFIEILELDEYTKTTCAERLKDSLKSESEAMVKEREQRAQQQQEAVLANARARRDQIQASISSALVTSPQPNHLSSTMPGDDLMFASNSSLFPAPYNAVSSASATQPPTSLRIGTRKLSESSNLVAGSPDQMFIRTRNHTGNYSSVYRGGSFSGPAAATHGNNAPYSPFDEALTKRALSPLVFHGNVTNRKQSMTLTPMRTQQFTSGLHSAYVSPSNTKQQYWGVESAGSGSFKYSDEPTTTTLTDPEKQHPPQSQGENNDSKTAHTKSDIHDIDDKSKATDTQSECLVRTTQTTDECHSTRGSEVRANNDSERIPYTCDNLPPSNVPQSLQKPQELPTNHQEHLQACQSKVQQQITIQPNSSTTITVSQLKGTVIPSKPSLLTAEVSESEKTADTPYLSLAPNSQGSVESSISSLSSYNTAPSSPVEDCGINPIQESQTSSDEKVYTKLVAGAGPGAIPVTKDQPIALSCKSKPCEKCSQLQDEIDGLTEDLRTLRRTYSQSTVAQDKQVTELNEQLFAKQQENYQLKITLEDRDRRHSQAENEITFLKQKLQELLNSAQANEMAYLRQTVQELQVDRQELISQNQQLREEVKDLKVEVYDYRKENDFYRKQSEIDQGHIEHLMRCLERVNSMQCPVVYEQATFMPGEGVDGTCTDENIHSY